MKKQRESGTPEKTPSANTTPAPHLDTPEEKPVEGSQPFIAMVRDLSAYVYLKRLQAVEVILPWGAKIPSLAVLKIPQKKLGSLRRCDVGKIQLERYSKQRELSHTRALLAKDKVKQ